MLVDACALAPRTLRDWLLLLRHLGSGSLFTLHYTEDILAETLRTIRRLNPGMEGTAHTEIRDRILAVMDGRIERYGHGQEEVRIMDVFDRHVHAAATDGGMAILVSADRTFLTLPDEITDSFEYEIYHPDDFYLLVDEAAPALVQRVLRYQLDYRMGLDQGDFDFADALRRSGCPRFADRVTDHLRALAHHD